MNLILTDNSENKWGIRVEEEVDDCSRYKSAQELNSASGTISIRNSPMEGKGKLGRCGVGVFCIAANQEAGL